MKYAEYIKRSVFVIAILFIAGSSSANFSEAVNLRVQMDNDDVIVSVKAGNKNVDFYMFTVNGSLVKQRNIQGSERFSIENLSKGTYLYELFSKDQRLKSGKIELK